MSVEFLGKKKIPLEYIVDGQEVSVDISDDDLNDAFGVCSGSPTQWMSGNHWDRLSVAVGVFITRQSSRASISSQVRLYGEHLKQLLRDHTHDNS